MLPNIKSLRMLLNMRLKEAVDELFGAVESTIAEYQQELYRSKEEKDRTIAEYKEKVSRSEEENARLQRLLDFVLKPEIRLQRLEDLQQLTLSISEEEVPLEQQHCKQDCSPGLGQGDPSQIKVEQEDLWVINQGREQLQAMDYDTDDTDDSADTEAFISTARVKGDCNQNPSQSSHLYQVVTQREENTDRDELPSTTMQIEQIKTENVSNSDSQPPSAVNSDWSETQIESVDWMESEGPPLKSKRTQTEVGPRFCTKVRESTELSHLKSPIPGNAVRHCRICAKPFITMTSLVIHAHRHRQLSRCGICGRTFESVESLKEHLHFHVASTGSLSCYICGICFTEDEEFLLEEHMSNHKLYRCLGCKERFRRDQLD